MEKATRYPFEYNVLLFACVLGFIRSVFAVIGDLEDIEAHPDFITDLLFCFLFLFGFLALKWIKTFKWILIFFFCPILALFVYSFHQGGGLEAGIEHNIFVALIFFNLTLRGKWPIYFSVVLIAAVIVSLIVLSNQMDEFQNNHFNDTNFILASMGIIGVSYYAKYAFSRRRDKLRENRVNLKNKTRQLKMNQNRLIKQKKALEELALVLDEKVSQKTKALSSQRVKREKYLSLTSNELSKSMEGTMKLIRDFQNKHENEPLVDMLAESANNLRVQIEKLNQKVDGSH